MNAETSGILTDGRLGNYDIGLDCSWIVYSDKCADGIFISLSLKMRSSWNRGFGQLDVAFEQVHQLLSHCAQNF